MLCSRRRAVRTPTGDRSSILQQHHTTCAYAVGSPDVHISWASHYSRRISSAPIATTASPEHRRTLTPFVGRADPSSNSRHACAWNCDRCLGHRSTCRSRLGCPVLNACPCVQSTSAVSSSHCLHRSPRNLANLFIHGSILSMLQDTNAIDDPIWSLTPGYPRLLFSSSQPIPRIRLTAFCTCSHHASLQFTLITQLIFRAKHCKMRPRT
jgi:hypothetical protein